MDANYPNYGAQQTPPPFNGGKSYQRQVSFSEAIQMGFSKYCCFTGRASRSEYWWWALFGLIVGCATSIIDFVLGTDEIISGLASLALLLPGLGLCVRRMHDIGKGGGWIFINLIPFIGSIIFIVFACQPSEPNTNRFGEVPNEVNM